MAEVQAFDTAVSLVGKLEASIEIKSKAEDFHDVFSCRPHHLSKVIPEKILFCGMHEGEWGTVGSTIVWDYVHAGIKCYVKEIIEAIDQENNSTTFRVIEGDVMQLFKDVRVTIQAIAKKEGDGSIVIWTMEYEKLHEDIPDPITLMDFAHEVTIDIDLHLQEAVAAASTATSLIVDDT